MCIAGRMPLIYGLKVKLYEDEIAISIETSSQHAPYMFDIVT
jgi:hypothetical protein